MNIDAGGLEPFKGRKLDVTRHVRVFRNLNREGVWYSIMQGGRTVAHARSVALRGCLFKVNIAGARRAVQNGRRNVHAFVAGWLIGRPDKVQEAHRARYNVRMGQFEVECDGGSQKALGAHHVWLGSFGMLVNGWT